MVSKPGGSFVCQYEIGRPVASYTSSARTSAAAVGGADAGRGRRDRRAARFRTARRRRAPPCRRRNSGFGGTRGTRQPSRSAHTYCPVPPARSGCLPRDQHVLQRSACASSSQRPRLNGSSGSTTSIRWCGASRPLFRAWAWRCRRPCGGRPAGSPRRSTSPPRRSREPHGERGLAGRRRPDDGDQPASGHQRAFARAISRVMPAKASTLRLAPPTSAPSIPSARDELRDVVRRHAAAVEDPHRLRLRRADTSSADLAAG